MDYKIIREARLRVPFRPFTLTFNDGWKILVDEPTHLSIASNALVVADENEVPQLHHPRDVPSLDFVDERVPSADLAAWKPDL
jgi:hypothetical protein